MPDAPRPRSEAQREAARRNGARSRGPVTPEGKARAAMNALRHGLCSAAVLAPGEDPAAFEALLAALRAEHAPADATAELLVQRLAVTLWKLARCDRLEADLAACRPRPPAGRAFADGTPVLLTRTSELSVLSAHAARLERALHHTLRALSDRPARAGARLPERGAPEPAGEPRAVSPEPETVAPVPTPEDRASEPERAAASDPDAPRPIAPEEPAPRGDADRAAPTVAQNRGNEPERAAAAAAPPVARTLAETAAPRPAPGADRPAVAQPEDAAGLGPDPELALLARARTDPDLAFAIAEELARQGELARFKRFVRALGADPAAALGLRRPAAHAA